MKGKFPVQRTFFFLTKINSWKDVRIHQRVLKRLGFLLCLKKLWKKRTGIFSQVVFAGISACFLKLKIVRLFLPAPFSEDTLWKKMHRTYSEQILKIERLVNESTYCLHNLVFWRKTRSHIINHQLLQKTFLTDIFRKPKSHNHLSTICPLNMKPLCKQSKH